MRKLSYTIIMLLSLLIIYSGVGISVMHYCCVRCETVQNCCVDDYTKCPNIYSCDSKKDCSEEGCTATIYKVDLMKHTSEIAVSIPVITIFYEQLHEMMASIYMDHSEAYSHFIDPPPVLPRQKLVMHSVLLI